MKLINKNALMRALNEYQYLNSPDLNCSNDTTRRYTEKELQKHICLVIGICIKMVEEMKEVKAIPIEWIYNHYQVKNIEQNKALDNLIDLWRKENDKSR